LARGGQRAIGQEWAFSLWYFIARPFILTLESLPVGLFVCLGIREDILDAPPLLAVEGIVKTYGLQRACDGVSLTVSAGSIHALLGENGAGKSTLVKIIYGLYRADAGLIFWKGQPISPPGPAAARRLGIGMVFQHFSLFDSLTVAQNIALGLEGVRADGALQQKIQTVAQRYGLSVDPDRPLASLSVGERQRVEIIRALLQNPQLLMMDEPTAVLTPQEALALFETLRALKADGCAILYISHRLEEIRQLCDSATILRAGQVVARCDPRDKSANALAELMVGSRLERPKRTALSLPREEGADPPARLALCALTTPTGEDPQAIPVIGAELQLWAGEIVGIAGVAGNGQQALMAALSGEILLDNAAALQLDGLPIAHMGPQERRALGLAAIPEERLGHGAVPMLSLAENALLAHHPGQALVRHGFVQKRRVRHLAEEIIRHFGVVTGSSKNPAASLSGGNLQKFIVGREILTQPKVLIAAAPTWGVDAGAGADIHRALLSLAAQGAAILLISPDLEELFTLADRIAVMSKGKLSPALPAHQLSMEAVGLMMGGIFAP
jgi:general nucleoside transport system ATP-binding protein